jgi:hypothetical protein
MAVFVVATVLNFIAFAFAPQSLLSAVGSGSYQLEMLVV